MIFGCTLAGGLSNKIGLKWTLVLGTLGYPFYSASLYVNNRYGTEWFVLFGAVTCGLSASCLWASEAAIVLGYPEHRKRGRYVSLWLAIRNIGQLIGGAINFGLNVRYSTTGKVGYATYLVLIALQCCGLPLALALSPPQKVVRDDGTRVVILKQTSWRAEAVAIWKLLRTKRILLLIPVFIFGQWSSPYESNYFATYFTVRSRALGSFMTACSGITGDIVTGQLLDHLPFSRRIRARIVWCWVAFLFTGLYTWQTTNQVAYDKSPPSLDWAKPGFGRGFASHIIWNYAIESLQTYLYWTMVRSSWLLFVFLMLTVSRAHLMMALEHLPGRRDCCAPLSRWAPRLLTRRARQSGGTFTPSFSRLRLGCFCFRSLLTPRGWCRTSRRKWRLTELWRIRIRRPTVKLSTWASEERNILPQKRMSPCR